MYIDLQHRSPLWSNTKSIFPYYTSLMIPTREQAHSILENWVENINLRKHMYCVEAAMRAYAEKYGEDADKWGIAGLLHDADWEKYPDEHPAQIVAKLSAEGVDEELVHAIASHGNNSEQYGERFAERSTLIDRALFACDELCGFIVACSLVRPSGIDDLAPKSAKKKLKDKAFAAQVSRDDIYQGAEELGVDLTEHIQFVIDAIRGVKDRVFA
ncbi:MAG: hypothetical protein TR69_WS6001000983 [candidate division WS6 bacterium OLB20]|uniref:HD domain-containing protein n=1 Tax=candidate division WS6 bacterium OLB20 TaxID=1617426 RepID=A0A136LZ79_9BACT|nr:MAG: hypothetical protein TR69_WS6001000983 [candidate division WS6 bacterium OLB20]